MDGIGQLFSFIGSLGDELSNILEGEGKAPPGEWELPDEFAGDDSEDNDLRNSFFIISKFVGIACTAWLLLCAHLFSADAHQHALHFEM
jgi:hypothetical protein